MALCIKRLSSDVTAVGTDCFMHYAHMNAFAITFYVDCIKLSANVELCNC